MLLRFDARDLADMIERGEYDFAAGIGCVIASRAMRLHRLKQREESARRERASKGAEAMATKKTKARPPPRRLIVDVQPTTVHGLAWVATTAGVPSLVLPCPHAPWRSRVSSSVSRGRRFRGRLASAKTPEQARRKLAAFEAARRLG
jgi:hypothetical protein